MFTEPPVTLNQIQGLQRSPCPWEAQAYCQRLPLLGAVMSQTNIRSFSLAYTHGGKFDYGL